MAVVVDLLCKLLHFEVFVYYCVGSHCFFRDVLSGWDVAVQSVV